jgi:hypothetical protein
MPAVETSGGHSVLKNTFAPTASGGKSKSLALKRGGDPWTVLTAAPARPANEAGISNTGATVNAVVLPPVTATAVAAPTTPTTSITAVGAAKRPTSAKPRSSG